MISFDVDSQCNLNNEQSTTVWNIPEEPTHASSRKPFLSKRSHILSLSEKHHYHWSVMTVDVLSCQTPPLGSTLCDRVSRSIRTGFSVQYMSTFLEQSAVEWLPSLAKRESLSLAQQPLSILSQRDPLARVQRTASKMVAQQRACLGSRAQEYRVGTIWLVMPSLLSFEKLICCT